MQALSSVVKNAKTSVFYTKPTHVSLGMRVHARQSRIAESAQKYSLSHPSWIQRDFPSTPQILNISGTSSRSFGTAASQPRSRKGRPRKAPSSIEPVSSGTPPTETGQLQPTVFPYGDASFSAVIQTPNVFYVDKSHFIPQLEAYGKANILLAPRRFGKSIFLDMLANYYDKNIDDAQFKKLFGNLYIGKQPTELRGKFYVFECDFSIGLETSSVEVFQKSLDSLLNDAMDDFRDKYPDFPAIQSSPRGVVTLRRIVTAARRNNLPMMILIDEYDNHINGMLATTEFVDGMKGVEDVDNTFKRFFSVLKSAIGKGNGQVRTFIAGVSPLVLSEFTSGFNIGRFPLRAPQFSSLFGFTESDVKRGLDSITMSSDAKMVLLDHIKEYHDGYLFSDELDSAKQPIFNTSRVLECLSMIQARVALMTVDNVLYALETLKDPNTKPASSALQAISSNPNTLHIILSLLASPSLTLPVASVSFDFSLVHLASLEQKSAQAVCSFLFFQGALTWAPSSSRKAPLLRIPNAIARTEFFEALLDMFHQSETALNKLRSALLMLIEAGKVEHFIQAFEDNMLDDLQGRDSIVGEAGLHNLLFASLVMSKRPKDVVYSEYKTDPERRLNNTPYSPAVDVVYQALSTEGRTRFVFSLKDIKTKDLGDNSNWESQQAFSRNLKNTTEEENLRSLKVGKNQTVGEIETAAIEELRTKYLPDLKKDAESEGKVISFVLTRIGLYKLLVSEPIL
jgi:hypothetical protein